jgi:glycosyltransferase involved in cell wall biosynthesis
MSRPKVAVIGTVDISMRYLLLDQMLAIKGHGYDVTALSAPGPAIAAVEASGIPHLPIPLTRRMSPLADLAALWSLARTLRRGRFTVVHTHTPKAGLLGQYAAVLAGVPVRLHTIHGLYFPGHMNPRRRWLYVLLERATMWFSHMNLSQNPEDIPVAIRERICAPDRIRLIGNGIDLAVFDPASQTVARRRATRAALGLAGGHKVVGTVARFVAEKGYRELLRAAQIIREQVPSARFLFIGPVEPQKRDALDPGIINEMGLDDVVQFLGHRTDVADLYAVMDVLALPSYREGFPRAPMEAAAMGVPTVATDIRGCRQAVDDGVTGRLVPPRDADALAAALLELLRDDAKRAAFGGAAREKALAEFDQRVVFQKVVAAYDDVIGRHAGVSPANAIGSPQDATHV